MNQFTYPPLATEDECNEAKAFPLLDEGIYNFLVKEAKFRFSQNGNPMIELKIGIIADGVDFNVFDFLIGTKNMVWKVKHFCETVGLQAEYLAGSFNEKMAVGKRGQCKIVKVPERPKKDGTGFYGPKNEVEDYIGETAQTKINPFAPPPAPKAQASAAPAPESVPFNDDVPF
jgi:hypothetical protein